ncbi:MAG: msbA, partial [Moraxellaceae bacterium]|nr:msbA [Moraxellaceae bacterium]
METQASHQASGWQVYKRLLRYTRRHWGLFLLGVVGFIINAQTEWAGAKLLQYIIDAIEHQNQDAKNLLPLLIVGIIFIRSFGIFMGNYFLSLVSRHIVYEMRQEIFDKLLTLPVG